MDRSVPESSGQIQPLEITTEADNNDVDEDDDNDDYHHVDGFEGNGEEPFCDEGVNGHSIDSLAVVGPTMSRLPQARRLLYASLFCYLISEMTWNFGWSIWLAVLGGNKSLFWVSAYQLAGRIMILLFVPSLSAKIDGSQNKNNPSMASLPKNYRSRLLTTWIVGQHLFVMLAILLVFGTLGIQRRIQEQQQQQEDDSQQQQQQQQLWMLHLSRLGVVLICVCGGLAEVLRSVVEVAINRDWIVVMAEEARKIESENDPSSDSSWLQGTNVRLRQINILCEIIGPLLSGGLLTFEGNSSLWIIFGLKGFSMVVFSCSMRTVCQWLPALQQHQQQNQNPQFSLTSASQFQDEPSNDRLQRSLYSMFCCYCSDCKIYLAQKGLLGAGIGLALLYGNIMTFGGTMVAYLSETGVGIESIGLWKGLSNVSAAFGTVAFSCSKQSLETKGLWGLIVMVATLSISLSGILMEQANRPDSGVDSDADTNDSNININSNSNSNVLPIGSVMVIAGTIASRSGLWAYDLSVTQLYQNNVKDYLRGTVGGTQTILNNGFEFVPFLLTMAVSGVQDFWIVMVVGYCSVVLALFVYWLGTYRFMGKAGQYGRVVEEVEEDVSGVAVEASNKLHR